MTALTVTIARRLVEAASGRPGLAVRSALVPGLVVRFSYQSTNTTGMSFCTAIEPNARRA